MFGLGDDGVGAVLDSLGGSLEDLCVHGTANLTGSWLRRLDPRRHALRRLNYAVSDHNYLFFLLVCIPRSSSSYAFLDDDWPP